MFLRHYVLWGSLLVGTSCAASATGQAGVSSGDVVRVSSEVQPIARIIPGTQIDDGPPRSWSHLVFKARSRIASGAVDSLPGFSKSLAELLFTAMLVRLRAQNVEGRTRYAIATVAVGLGTRIEGRDTIISSETRNDLGADLGILQSLTLSKAEKQLGKMLRVARSETMVIVDAPTVLLRNGQNEEVVLRYCFLIDRATGTLASLVWPIQLDAQSGYVATDGSAVLMQPNLVDTTPLHVDGDEILAAIPSPRAIGGARLPTGTAFKLPASARGLAVQQRFAPQAIRRLETELRTFVRFP